MVVQPGGMQGDPSLRKLPSWNAQMTSAARSSWWRRALVLALQMRTGPVDWTSGLDQWNSVHFKVEGDAEPGMVPGSLHASKSVEYKMNTLARCKGFTTRNDVFIVWSSIEEKKPSAIMLAKTITVGLNAALSACEKAGAWRQSFVLGTSDTGRRKEGCPAWVILPEALTSTSSTDIVSFTALLGAARTSWDRASWLILALSMQPSAKESSLESL
eukprot:Skav201358  [mRNA]  locus=scaffold2471:25625:28310:- [translate_table: standard]